MTRFAQMGLIHYFEPPGPVIKKRERAEAFIAEAHGQRKGAANASYCSNNLVKFAGATKAGLISARAAADFITRT